MPDNALSLTEMLDAFDAYRDGTMPFPLLLQVESDFFQTADAASLDVYARKIGCGKYFGLHPTFVAHRTDIVRIEMGKVQFGGGIWKLRHFTDEREIVKDSEFVLHELLLPE